MQERSTAHMKALQRMRETAEAAEAACCAAEHEEAPQGASADFRRCSLWLSLIHI